MGLIKRDGMIIKGILIQPSYAKIMRLENDAAIDSRHSIYNTTAIIGYSNSRENLDNNEVLYQERVEFNIDRQKDRLYEDSYNWIKENFLQNWEDDIRENN